MAIIAILYLVAGYWSVGRTIYANRIIIGTGGAIFMRKFMLAVFLGWLTIPWAIIKLFIH